MLLFEYLHSFYILIIMKQVIIIHGGDSFPNYESYLQNLRDKELDYDRLKPKNKWQDQVVETLTDADILLPSMPNKQNAQYHEWEIMFEKLIPFFSNDVQLVGHSLGGMFLVKYLVRNPLSTPVRRLILLAPGYNDKTQQYGNFVIQSAKGLEQSAAEIHIFHSKDDFVVPYSELEKFKADLPGAIIHSFEDKNHFLDDTFPELIRLLEQK